MFKILFQKFSSRHRSTFLRSNVVKFVRQVIGEIVRYLPDKTQYFGCLSNSRYCADYAQNLPGLAPNNVLTVLHILSKCSLIGRCVWMTACNCTSLSSSSITIISANATTSSLSGDCDTLTGRCHCQSNVVGVNCDRCAQDAFNFSVSAGCQRCHCHTLGARSVACDEVNDYILTVTLDA